MDYAIQDYFTSGLSYSEILYVLLKCHGISISLRKLHRIFRRLSPYRRREKSPLNSVFSYMLHALKGSQSCYGYRSMHQAIRRAGLTIDRETVRMAMTVFDPVGVANRARRKLIRRQYRNLGPNYAWHIDCYDKLKPYGFAIHAAIDGYSRKVLWLRASYTNNNPKVIAYYYVDYVKRTNVIPKLLQADRGSENIVLAGIQRFFSLGKQRWIIWLR